MTAHYWLGVLTLPALALLVLAANWAWHRWLTWWTEWVPRRVELDILDRSRIAAFTVYARRFWWIQLPGGTVIAYKSNRGQDPQERDATNGLALVIAHEARNILK